MLGAMLGSGPRCITTPESRFKQALPLKLGVDWKRGVDREELLEALSKDFRFWVWEIPVPETELPPLLKLHDYRDLMFSLVDSYAEEVNKNKLNWNIWVDHTPHNFHDALMLLDIFPNAKFIYIVRDPRAVASSIIPLHWGPNTALEAAAYWAQKLPYGLAFVEAFPEKCLKVKYEDIVSHPEQSLREICRFCDINFDPAMVFGRTFKVPNFSKKQHKLVGNAPDPKRVDAWKKELTEWQIYQIEDFLGDLIDMMGYTKSDIKVSPPNTPQRATLKMKNLQTSLSKLIKRKMVRLRRRFAEIKIKLGARGL